ncbi:MAG TPA: ABC transporter permease [Anaerolineae bacterium]
MNNWGRKLIFFSALLLAWQGLYALQWWPPYVFPSPLSVGHALLAGFKDGSYPLAVWVSLRRILMGYSLALAVGIPLGLALGRIPLVQDTIGTLVLGLQALPSICWLPLALLWFGLSEKAILFVVVMGSVLSISLSTADGVHNTSPLYLRAGRTLGAGGLKLYTTVILPAALPAIISGMKLGWSFAWRSLMAGELLYVSLGLGQLLAMGRELNDMSQVIAVMLVIVTIGLVIDRALFNQLETSVRERWGLQTRSAVSLRGRRGGRAAG